VFPIDNQSTQSYAESANTVEELFILANKEMFSEKKVLMMSEVSFLTLPGDLAAEQINERAVEQLVPAYKKLIGSFDISSRPKREETIQKMKQLGITAVKYVLDLNEEILKDDQKLRDFIRRELEYSAKASKLYKLQIQFTDRYVIPYNVRMATRIFDAHKVSITRNGDLPQPHRELTQRLVFSATK
jgi:hypothetical protein